MAPDVLPNAAPLKSVVVKQNLEMILTPKNRIQKFPAKPPGVSQPFGRMQAARITGRLLGFWRDLPADQDTPMRNADGLDTLLVVRHHRGRRRAPPAPYITARTLNNCIATVANTATTTIKQRRRAPMQASARWCGTRISAGIPSHNR
jgi:hypothetical protein